MSVPRALTSAASRSREPLDSVASANTCVVRTPLDHLPPQESLWHAAGRLADGAPGIEALRAHRLHLIAAKRLRERGTTVPEELLESERIAAVSRSTARIVLARAREAYDGKLALLKGPEAAACYPDPAVRPFFDLDLLAEDAGAAQRALISAGFIPLADPEGYVGIHQEAPLALGGLPVLVEVHRTPKWLSSMTPPSNEELFAAAIPSATGVNGVMGLARAHHALVLVAHSWANHVPFSRILDLVDVAVVATGIPRRELDELADRWGMGRAWRTTAQTIDSLLFNRGATPLALRVWARNLRSARTRTVLEWHLERWLGGYWAMSPALATRKMLAVARRELTPSAGESWSTKLARTRLAFRDALRPRSEHDKDWEQRQRAEDGTDREHP